MSVQDKMVTTPKYAHVRIPYCDVVNLVNSIFSCQLEVGLDRSGSFVSSMLYVPIFNWTVVLTANLQRSLFR